MVGLPRVKAAASLWSTVDETDDTLSWVLKGAVYIHYDCT